MIYGILSTIVFILVLPFWLILGMFKPKLITGFKEKLGLYEDAKMRRCIDAKLVQEKNLLCLHSSIPPVILFYGVSVGEVLAMENLIKKTKETYPNVKIVVMTGTKTGQEIAQKKLSKTADFITYFPFDFPFCINNMIKKINPSAIFVMETELWPNFAHITNKKKIPTYIINARISDRTFKSYKKLQFLFSPILKKYTAIFPQSKQDFDKFISLGSNPNTTKVMGNLKFDIKKPDSSSLNFEKNQKDKIILAGSTHSGEEEIILEVFSDLKKEISELKLIIAPRHPERNEKVYDLIKSFGFDCIKRSESNPPTLQPSLLLLDTMGELGKFYSVCDIAFIGGSFPLQGGDNKSGKGIGGHNPLEATIFNKPAVSGPSIHNFKDIYAILTCSDAGKVVKDKNELKEQFYKLLINEEFYKKASNDCETVFEQNKGALNFVLNILQTLV